MSDVRGERDAFNVKTATPVENGKKSVLVTRSSAPNIIISAVLVSPCAS